MHRQFQGSLNRFCAAVGEMGPCWRRYRNNGVEFLRKLRHVTVVIIGSTHMNKLPCLVLNGFYHVRMAVTCGADCDARIAIKKNVSVHVFDPNAAGTFSNKFE